MSHANARLTPAGRLITVQRIQAGRAVAQVASEMGLSRTTAWLWWRRFRQFGLVGLQDRSSVPHSHPRRINTAASPAVSSGANLEAVQRMLGHASAARTLDTYSDLFDDDLDIVSVRLDEAASRVLSVATRAQLGHDSTLADHA